MAKPLSEMNCEELVNHIDTVIDSICQVWAEGAVDMDDVDISSLRYVAVKVQELDQLIDNL